VIFLLWYPCNITHTHNRRNIWLVVTNIRYATSDILYRLQSLRFLLCLCKMRVHLFTSSWLISIFFFFFCSGLQFSRSFLFSHYLSLFIFFSCLHLLLLSFCAFKLLFLVFLHFFLFASSSISPFLCLGFFISSYRFSSSHSRFLYILLVPFFLYIFRIPMWMHFLHFTDLSSGLRHLQSYLKHCFAL